MRKAVPLAEKLERFAMPVTESGCHLWIGRKHPGRDNGYLWHEGKPRLAHRMAWEMAYGAIPDGLCVCHRCDVPACVNVKHLFLGTMKENSEDMIRKGRSPNREGQRNSAHKVTDDQAAAIRLDKRPRKVIAEEYGIAVRQVGRIRGYEAWKHLP